MKITDFIIRLLEATNPFNLEPKTRFTRFLHLLFFLPLGFITFLLAIVMMVSACFEFVIEYIFG